MVRRTSSDSCPKTGRDARERTRRMINRTSVSEPLRDYCGRDCTDDGQVAHCVVRGYRPVTKARYDRAIPHRVSRVACISGRSNRRDHRWHRCSPMPLWLHASVRCAAAICRDSAPCSVGSDYAGWCASSHDSLRGIYVGPSTAPLDELRHRPACVQRQYPHAWPWTEHQQHAQSQASHVGTTVGNKCGTCHEPCSSLNARSQSRCQVPYTQYSRCD